MGLIKAAMTTAIGAVNEQWKEFFYCDALDNDVLAARGRKRVTGRSGNDLYDNVITNGSGIAVADGQCMIIVDQGKVTEFCAEPGQFTYDTSSEPTIFEGDLGQGIKQLVSTMITRFTYGGEQAKDQRVYYFNTKEIIDNKFGTQNPIPFRFVDNNIGLDIDMSVRCNGVYSFRITNPLLFYTNLCGNMTDRFTKDQIAGQMKSEFLSALQPAFTKISDMGIRYSSLPGHSLELSEAMREELDSVWSKRLGISLVTVAINSITVPKEDEERIKQLQTSKVLSDPTMAAATLVNAQADAMRTAAGNPGGAVNGFMGVNMAQGTGGMNAQNLFAMGQQNNNTVQAAPQGGWKCECGTVNTGNFCSNCGKPKPETNEWKCECGTVNTGNFCSNCGKPRPTADEWTCECGTVNKGGKFCSNCGKPRS
ncbi:MAG: SPFH domain-containing protein [Eubacteriaceae bacterium]|nr:SPFH domain-containing protein [Eubacteriaceae bacterium]